MSQTYITKGSEVYGYVNYKSSIHACGGQYNCIVWFLSARLPLYRWGSLGSQHGGE